MLMPCTELSSRIGPLCGLCFREAWGRPPTESRLMHSAGIEAMSLLMDRIMSRAAPETNLELHATQALARIAPHCRWTSGRWQDLQRDWNEIQNVGRDIKLLSGHLGAPGPLARLEGGLMRFVFRR